MRVSRWMGVTAATVATAGGLIIGGGSAFADTPAPTPAPAPNAKTCTQRIPALLAKIDKTTTKINGDAGVKGSTAWLQAKEDKARAAGRTAAADLIQDRISNRPQRLAELAKVKAEVQKVQSTDCATSS